MVLAGHKCTPLIVQGECGSILVLGSLSKRQGRVLKATFTEGVGALHEVAAGVRLGLEVDRSANGEQAHDGHRRELASEWTARYNRFEGQEDRRQHEPRHQLVLVIDVTHRRNARLFEVIFELQQGSKLDESGRCSRVGPCPSLRSFNQG